MVTPSLRSSGVPRPLFKSGTPVVLCGDAYIVSERVGMGGFGDVYGVRLRDDPSQFRIAKFLRDIDEFKAASIARDSAYDEIVRKIRQMFEREWKTLRKMAKFRPGAFPEFYGAGKLSGRPFYLMEKLSPMSQTELLASRDDGWRIHFIGDLCDAVSALHENGLVHYDIKPANILFRRGKNMFVLGDFGSVHKEQKHVSRSDMLRCQVESSISMLSDGRRIAPRTIGYCDPIDSLHTIHADIYAIGQVIRDMFADEVPATWARIILKCINRQFAMRYNSVAEVKADVLSMGGDGIRLLSRQLSGLMDPSGAAWIRGQHRIFVSASAGSNGDGSVKRPFGTISRALEAAYEDSVIAVGPGIYKEAVAIKGKKLNVIGTEGPQKTVIEGQRGASAVCIGKGADGSVLKGFTITGGTGQPHKSDYGFDYYGGGVNACVSAEIEDCAIVGNGIGIAQQNAATFGGGVYVSRATVTVRNCLVSGNYAWASGGGLMADGPGGALIVVDTNVEDNRSDDFFGIQGGISLANEATLSVSSSVVAGNAGDQIGAYGNVYARGTRAQVETSFIEGGARACNISIFIPRGNNHRDRPEYGCGCRSDIKSPNKTDFR